MQVKVSTMTPGRQTPRRISHKTQGPRLGRARPACMPGEAGGQEALLKIFRRAECRAPLLSKYLECLEPSLSLKRGQLRGTGAGKPTRTATVLSAGSLSAPESSQPLECGAHLAPLATGQ